MAVRRSHQVISAPEPPESAEIIARTEELVRLAETARQAVDNERRKKEQGGLVRNRRNMFKGAKGKAEAGASESEDGEEDGTSTSNVYRGDTSCTGNVTAGEETESTAGEIDLPHAGEPQDPRVEEQEQSRDDSKDEQDGLLEEFLKGAERLAASMSNELDKFEDSSNNDEDGQEDASAGASDDEDEQRSKSSSDTTTSTSTTGFKNSKKSSSSISATATQKIKDELRKKLPDLHANKDFVVPVGLTEPEPKVFPIPSDFALLGDVQDPSDPVVEAFRPFDSWKLEKQKRDEEEQKERLFREARAKLEEIRVERGDLDFSNFLGAEEPSMSGGGDVDFSTLMNTSKAATELMLNMKASSTSMAAAEKNSSTRSGGAAGARSCRAALSTTRTSTSTSRRNSGSAGTVYGNTLSATASAVRTAVDGRDHCLRGGGSSRRVQEHKGSSTSSRDHGTSIFREVDQHHGVGHGAGQSSTLGGAGAQIMESSAGFTIMRVPGTDPRNRNLETDSSMAIHHDQNNGEDGAVLFMQDNYAGRKRTPGVDGHKRRDDHERFFDSSSRQDEAALSEGIPHIDQLCDGYRHMKTASCSRTTLTSNIKDKNDVLSRTSSKEHQNRSSSTSRGQARSGGSAASGSSLGGNSMGAAAASSSSKGRNQSRAGGSSTTSDTLATTALSSRNRKASKAASEIEAAPVNSSVQRFYEAVRFGNVNVVRIMLNEISGHLKVDEYSRMAAASEAIFAGVEAQKGYAMTEFLLRNGFNPNVRAGANAGGAAVKVQTNPKNTRGTKETNSLLGMVTPGETPIITCVKKKIRHGTNSAWTSDRDSLGILKLLVAHAADVNARCSLTGRTALWYAGKFNNRPAVEALLELGADPRIPDRRQHMPGDVTTNSEVDVLLQRALAKWQQSQVFRVAAKKAAQDVAGGASMLSSTAGNTRGEGGGRERSARGAANTTGAHTSDSLDEDSSAVSRSTSDTRKDTHNLPGLAPVFDLECEILLRERRVEDLRNRKGIKIVDFPEHAPICIVKVMRDDIAGLEALCTCEVSKEKFVVRGPSGELLVDRRGGRVAALREQDLEF
ncbi:unnamed protein product [Amoebophrya sp. A25]|nr:unnamed protein product [Amoebophrya sp. A25]|eukprot:GSA25T00009624001.1